MRGDPTPSPRREPLTAAAGGFIACFAMSKFYELFDKAEPGVPLQEDSTVKPGPSSRERYSVTN